MTTAPRKLPAGKQADKFPCTDCCGDAFIGYVANEKSDWGGLVKVGERLCTRCFQKRGGINFFAPARKAEGT